jgi:hypothetical protein
MARNGEENVYITLGFARCSATWQRLQREAKELDISVPHLIKVLLADRTAALEGEGKQLWFPREMQVPRTAQAVCEPATTASPPAGDPASRRAMAAAAAAADFWEE